MISEESVSKQVTAIDSPNGDIKIKSIPEQISHLRQQLNQSYNIFKKTESALKNISFADIETKFKSEIQHITEDLEQIGIDDKNFSECHKLFREEMGKKFTSEAGVNLAGQNRFGNISELNDFFRIINELHDGIRLMDENHRLFVNLDEQIAGVVGSTERNRINVEELAHREPDMYKKAMDIIDSNKETNFDEN